jgi:hypothetical protein
VIRFAVGSPNGPRGSIWRLWAKRNDVYIAARDLGRDFKASLHEFGGWREGLTAEHAAKWGVPGGQDRAVKLWQRHSEFAPGMTLAFRISVPWSEVTPAPPLADEKRPIVWIPPPPVGAITAFTVLYLAPWVPVTGWPGQRSMGTQLVGQVPLANGETVWVVVREEPLQPRMQAELDKAKRAGLEAMRLVAAAKGRPVVAERMLVSGDADEGTRSYLDVSLFSSEATPES